MNHTYIVWTTNKSCLHLVFTKKCSEIVKATLYYNAQKDMNIDKAM